MSKQIEWIESHVGQTSNPLTAALGVFANAASADPQSVILTQLIERVEALEASRIKVVAPGVLGQGDLATQNIQDLRPLWLADQRAHSLEWTDDGNDRKTAFYRGFKLRIAPETKGRWSSSAVEEEGGHSVPWPVWQSSADYAKATIIRAVDAALAERE